MRPLHEDSSMTSKRHAKPTAITLAERSYRRLLRMDDALQAISPAVIALEGHVRTLTDHCARLLREKETLQRKLTIEIGKSYTVTGDELGENLYKTESHKL
jgi:hypothetical protein